MAKRRRRTATERVAAREMRAMEGQARGLVGRLDQIREESERAAFWLRLGAPDAPAKG